MTTIAGCDIKSTLFTARGHNQVMNELNRETMETIRDVFWPFHFMTIAFARYGNTFEKRDAKYQRRKARILHHQRPNEWSGALKRAVLTESKVRATATRGTLQAMAPLTSTLTYGPFGNRVNRRPLTEQRRKEMEVVSQAEIDLLMARQQQRYVQMASDPRFASVVRQRIR